MLTPTRHPLPLPPACHTLLMGAPLVGVTGSRAPSCRSRRALAGLLLALPARVPVAVGCARGIDARVRAARPAAHVFTAHSREAGPLAARSARLIASVAARGGLVAAFPGTACPEALVPARSARRCFRGYGSGTWASVALAVGLGCAVLVYLPPGIHPPPWLGVSPSFPAGWHLHVPTSAQTVLL